MKITTLKIKNVGMIADTTIELNKPLLVFYGEIRQGKTTILNAVRWVCGGAFPADLIRHGEKEASIQLGFDGGCILRTWYRTKATEEKPSEVKARAVQYVKAGKPVENPAAELKKLLNPFMLNQDFLRNKSELERKQYFTELFAVDTSALDTEAFNLSRKASELRAKLTGYGDIDLTEVKEVDTADLRRQLAEMRQAHEVALGAWKAACRDLDSQHVAAVASVSAQNNEIRRSNQLVIDQERRCANLKDTVKRLRAELRDAEENLLKCNDWLIINLKKDETPTPPQSVAPEMPAPPDTSALEAQLQTAAATNVRAENYKAALERDKKRQADEAALKSTTDRERAIKKEKIAELAKVNESCGVPGLAFTEDGNFSFEVTQAGMLSTSQIMRLSSLLSAIYPEGLSIELLDRGESLGRSIFDYVKHAEAKKISVLASVVGQVPADVPERVGVFVVKDGVVMKDEVAHE